MRMIPVGERVAAIDWQALTARLDAEGAATTGPLLSGEECRALVALYEEEGRFRTRVVMARHGYGSGEYRYFGYPMPALVASLRDALYPRLVPLANAWASALGLDTRYPPALEGFLARCQEAGQSRPTPLLLRYRQGDYNCLHQDLYGATVFPLQVAFLLNDPGRDYSGGEFVLTEQRPRMQSRVEVVPVSRGEGVVFAVAQRPVRGTRGTYRVTMRHGVSRLRAGERHTLGIIFHDAA